MLIQDWAVVLKTSLQGLGAGFIDFVPKLIIAIILFILGWVLGSIIGKWVGQLITALKIDKLFNGTSFDEALTKSGFKLNVGSFIGGIIKWFIVIAFLIPSLEILNLNEVNLFLTDKVLLFIPKLFVAALVLVVATLIADIVKVIVVSAAETAKIKSANLLGVVTKYSIWVFAFIIAFHELGVAPWFMETLFMAIVYMIGLAVALAFGLGGKDAAARSIEKVKSEMTRHGGN
ncbi:hypothetical protein A2995_00915 [Candidatus Nomurabacteria bacterium RIFCSPLOWO2_01_FULL_33_24]|uniref:Small-conductance mechanosensitive ion channel n=1 Tax=Candidatus Nomurabacteria bacterium RIFCSPLOWO2_01_FULL_33_24 TaxID=1801765 RepID=A0A1F6X2Q1_9BACT|nr:MAG: hypothetical protein A2995_00915 [Candidatus Nomurabacteria bacterium RIFCSPLOWO2_01_FULL_33_24]